MTAIFQDLVTGTHQGIEQVFRPIIGKHKVKARIGGIWSKANCPSSIVMKLNVILGTIGRCIDSVTGTLKERQWISQPYDIDILKEQIVSQQVHHVDTVH